VKQALPVEADGLRDRGEAAELLEDPERACLLVLRGLADVEHR
jgi:hypothetical protein